MDKERQSVLTEKRMREFMQKVMFALKKDIVQPIEKERER